MTGQSDEIHVEIRYKDVEKKFNGSLEEVWLSLDHFFREFLPSFDTAKKLILSVDLQKLAKECEDLIAFSAEGANVLIPRNKLTDNETLALWLLANYLGCRLGMLRSDSLTKEELQNKVGKNAKITGTRLGELVKNEIVTRTADGKYRISTFGLAQLQNDVLPKVKLRTSS